jgi:hypothetical protein
MKTNVIKHVLLHYALIVSFSADGRSTITNKYCRGARFSSISSALALQLQLQAIASMRVEIPLWASLKAHVWLL